MLPTTSAVASHMPTPRRFGVPAAVSYVDIFALLAMLFTLDPMAPKNRYGGQRREAAQFVVFTSGFGRDFPIPLRGSSGTPVGRLHAGRAEDEGDEGPARTGHSFLLTGPRTTCDGGEDIERRLR